MNLKRTTRKLLLRSVNKILKRVKKLSFNSLERRSADNLNSVISQNLGAFFWTTNISQMNYLIGSGIS